MTDKTNKTEKNEQEGRHGSRYGFRWVLLRDMNQKYPKQISSRQIYDGAVFTWGGTGFKQARREKVVTNCTAKPVSFEELITALKQHSIDVMETVPARPSST